MGAQVDKRLWERTGQRPGAQSSKCNDSACGRPLGHSGAQAGDWGYDGMVQTVHHKVPCHALYSVAVLVEWKDPLLLSLCAARCRRIHIDVISNPQVLNFALVADGIQHPTSVQRIPVRFVVKRKNTFFSAESLLQPLEP